MRDSLKKTCNLLIRSIIMSDLSESIKVAHLSWATLVICSFVMSDISDLLICHERPEQFAHSHSFVLSNLSKSLTVAHLIWAIWANEWMSDERICKFPTLTFLQFVGLFKFYFRLIFVHFIILNLKITNCSVKNISLKD